MPQISKSIYLARKGKTLFTSNLKNKYDSIKKFGADLLEYSGKIKSIYDRKFSNLEVINFSSSSKSDHVLLYDKNLVDNFKDGEEMFVDGTFRIRPKVKGVKQILTIMSKKNHIVRIFILS